MSHKSLKHPTSVIIDLEAHPELKKPLLLFQVPTINVMGNEAGNQPIFPPLSKCITGSPSMNVSRSPHCIVEVNRDYTQDSHPAVSPKPPPLPQPPQPQSHPPPSPQSPQTQQTKSDSSQRKKTADRSEHKSCKWNQKSASGGGKNVLCPDEKRKGSKKRMRTKGKDTWSKYLDVNPRRHEVRLIRLLFIKKLNTIFCYILYIPKQIHPKGIQCNRNQENRLQVKAF